MSRCQSVYGAFRAAEQAYAARPMLYLPELTAKLYGTTASTFTYADVRRLTDHAFDAYRSAGFGAGDRVALILENRPEFFVHFLALNRLGVSTVPIHHELSAEEVAYRLSHSEASLVIALPVHLELAVAACRLANADIPVVAMGDAVPIRPGTTTPVKVNEQTEAAILYTSGSTGEPKGCLLSNEYFLLMGQWYLNAGGLCELSPVGERLISPLPLSHMNALACSFMAMMMSGGCLIQLDRFHPSIWWRTVRESRAKIVHYLGVMPAILLGMEATADDDFSGQIRFGFGAGVDPRHHGRFEQRFGFPLIEGWAMTETGGGACIAATREPRHVGTRCFGRAGDAIDYRIVDEAGIDVEAGHPGELLVRAAGDEPRRGFFSGYFKDEDATRDAWLDGWFHTGDVVRIDTDGSFFFVDRCKNIVRRSGENISSVEVEGALSSMPMVRLCAVVPVEDELRGEEVMACIVLEDGIPASRDTAEAIFAAARDSLAYFKVPGYIAFLEELPLTSSEKLQRGTLKQLCTELCEAGDVFDLRGRKRRPG